MTKIQDRDAKTNGRWTKVQHQKFMFGLQLYGKNWKKIQQLVGTRTGSQIRSHAQKFFLKIRKHSDGTDNSDGSQESHFQQSPTTVISKPQEMAEYAPQHSYFMTKIIKATADQQNLNFWQEFIDMSALKYNPYCVREVIRKDSFAIFDNCNDSKQETSIYNAPVLGEPLQ